MSIDIDIDMSTEGAKLGAKEVGNLGLGVGETLGFNEGAVEGAEDTIGEGVADTVGDADGESEGTGPLIGQSSCLGFPRSDC
jgi:hypothetical protein